MQPKYESIVERIKTLVRSIEEREVSESESLERAIREVQDIAKSLAPLYEKLGWKNKAGGKVILDQHTLTPIVGAYDNTDFSRLNLEAVILDNGGELKVFERSGTVNTPDGRDDFWSPWDYHTGMSETVTDFGKYMRASKARGMTPIKVKEAIEREIDWIERYGVRPKALN